MLQRFVGILLRATIGMCFDVSAPKYIWCYILGASMPRLGIMHQLVSQVALHPRSKALPLEVWAVIFSHLSQADVIRLSHASRRMRSVVIGIPSLWSYLRLSGCERSIPGKDVVKLAFELLAVYLQRSRGHGFHLVLWPDKQLAPHVQDLVSLCASELITLELVVNREVLHRVAVHLPRLQVLNITGFPRIRLLLSNIIRADNTSSLHTLRTPRNVEWRHVSKYAFPNARILEVDVDLTMDIGIILLACPAVRKLTITMRRSRASLETWARLHEFPLLARAKEIAQGVRCIHLMEDGYNFGSDEGTELLSLFDFDSSRRFFRIDSSTIWQGAAGLFEKFVRAEEISHVFQAEHIFVARNVHGDVRELHIVNAEESHAWDYFFNKLGLPPKYLIPVRALPSVDDDDTADWAISSSQGYCCIA